MNASPPDLVDWSLAVRVASVVAGKGPETTPHLRADVRRDFREFTGRSDGLVRDFTGLAPEAPAPEPIVLDRAGWVRANIESFQGLIRPLAERLAISTGVRGPVRRVVSGAVGAQMGVLLGYLSQKVLGQYDLVLATEGGGRVYFVGPNVVDIERRLGFVPRDFRFWITLHEITHRTQFTGVPWLRDRVQTLIERALGGMDLDPANVRRIISRGKELLLRGPSAWRSASVMSILMSDEQRALLDEMQALMSVVEGHGTFVMNRIGAELIPTFETMRDAIDARRGSATGAERTLQRAIGMDMKYDQYILGEKFFNEIAARAGMQSVNKVWEDEASMPTLDEMRDPERWLSRVGA
ncbi:MAG: zinc-dependent metalloprotease [Actinomycetota bacterium]